MIDRATKVAFLVLTAFALGAIVTMGVRWGWSWKHTALCVYGVVVLAFIACCPEQHEWDE